MLRRALSHYFDGPEHARDEWLLKHLENYSVPARILLLGQSRAHPLPALCASACLHRVQQLENDLRLQARGHCGHSVQAGDEGRAEDANG